eukprot:scaffold327_cov257-Pinguiococcus_pyrenoidosus.AAC.18
MLEPEADRQGPQSVVSVRRTDELLGVQVDEHRPHGGLRPLPLLELKEDLLGAVFFRIGRRAPRAVEHTDSFAICVG